MYKHHVEGSIATGRTTDPSLVNRHHLSQLIRHAGKKCRRFRAACKPLTFANGASGAGDRPDGPCARVSLEESLGFWSSLPELSTQSFRTGIRRGYFGSTE